MTSLPEFSANVRTFLISVMLFWPAGAFAQSSLDAETFEALTTGKTFTYGDISGAYGAEEYLPGRRVLWSFLDGRCLEGTWYQTGPQICFVYDDDPGAHCWLFYQNDGRLSAHFGDDPDAAPLIEMNSQDERLYCMGPDIGV